MILPDDYIDTYILKRARLAVQVPALPSQVRSVQNIRSHELLQEEAQNKILVERIRQHIKIWCSISSELYPMNARLYNTSKSFHLATIS